MSVVRIVSSTMAQANPSLIGAGKPYRYRGDPDWTPGDARYRDGASPPGEPHPANADRTAGRAARLAEFAGYLAQGLTTQQAGKLMRIAPSTAREYARELERQQRGEADG